MTPSGRGKQKKAAILRSEIAQLKESLTVLSASVDRLRSSQVDPHRRGGRALGRGVPPQWHTRRLDSAPPPLLTVVFRKDNQVLRFFSTITTFGTPRDVTIDELRIECSFPADETTAEVCRALAREQD